MRYNSLTTLNTSYKINHKVRKERLLTVYVYELQPVDLHSTGSRICNRTTALCTPLPLLPPAGQGDGGAAQLWFLAEEASMLKTRGEKALHLSELQNMLRTPGFLGCASRLLNQEKRKRPSTDTEQRRTGELVSAADVSGLMHTVTGTAAPLQPSGTCDPWHRHSSTPGALPRIQAPHLSPHGDLPEATAALRQQPRHLLGTAPQG